MLNKQQQKNVLVLSGPSGSGKGTVVHLLQSKYTEIERAVSVTTRAQRSGETDGVDYYYRSREQFEQKIAEGKLLEYTEYVGNYYGTLHSEVARIVDSGKICVLEIEVKGAANVKKQYPDCRMVFILPPNECELEKRLRGRGSEDEKDIIRRLEEARKEMQKASVYDHTVVNIVAEDCATEIYEFAKSQ